MNLAAIEARLEAAPEPEKWQVEEGWEGYRVFYKDDGPGDLPIAEEICQGTDSGEALAEFIAHAPEDMRALIAALERQSELIMGLEAEVHAQRQKLEAVKKLHRPISAECLGIEEIDSACAGCSGQLPNGRFVGKVVPYPCPTMRALGVTE